jgi:hypothetical protein
MAMVELEPVPEEDDILEKLHATMAATWKAQGPGGRIQGDMTAMTRSACSS